jgi:hypothetical protein
MAVAFGVYSVGSIDSYVESWVIRVVASSHAAGAIEVREDSVETSDFTGAVFLLARCWISLRMSSRVLRRKTRLPVRDW